jgi:hypothetical protein
MFIGRRAGLSATPSVPAGDVLPYDRSAGAADLAGLAAVLPGVKMPGRRVLGVTVSCVRVPRAGCPPVFSVAALVDELPAALVWVGFSEAPEAVGDAALKAPALLVDVATGVGDSAANIGAATVRASAATARTQGHAAARGPRARRRSEAEFFILLLPSRDSGIFAQRKDPSMLSAHRMPNENHAWRGFPRG